MPSVVENEENRGWEETRHGESKGPGKSKDIWVSLEKRVGEVKTIMETLRAQVEDVHQ